MQTQAVSGALGIMGEGAQELRGLGRRETAGAQCGWSVLPDLTKRGMAEGLPAWGKGLQGWPAAIAAVCPKTPGQRCRVHKVRQSLQDVPWPERTVGAADRRGLSAAVPLGGALRGPVPDAQPALARRLGGRPDLACRGWA